MPLVEIRGDPIPNFPFRHVFAHFDHLACHIAPQDGLLFRRQRICTMGDAEVSPVQGNRMDADEDFVSPGGGDRDGLLGESGGTSDGGKTVGDVLLVHCSRCIL